MRHISISLKGIDIIASEMIWAAAAPMAILPLSLSAERLWLFAVAGRYTRKSDQQLSNHAGVRTICGCKQRLQTVITILCSFPAGLECGIGLLHSHGSMVNDEIV